MAEEDHIKYEATFNQSNELVSRMAADLQAEAAELRQLGETGRAAMREAQAKLLQATSAPAAAAAEAPQIEEANTALRRQNAIKLAGREIDAQMLADIRAATQAEIDRLEVVQYLQGSRSRVPAPEPTVPSTSGASLAWQRRAEELASAQRRIEQAASGTGLYVANPRSGVSREQVAQQEQEAVNQKLAQEEALRRRALAAEQAQLEAARQLAAEEAAIADYLQRASQVGFTAGATGRPVKAQTRDDLLAGPGVAGWGEQQKALAAYNMTLGEHAGFERNAAVSTEELTANVTRLGMAQAEASNSMRRHGALTTEYLSALARGETTISEFGYQLGATVAKFSGWAVAAAATYTAFGAVREFGRGASDAATGAQRLSRTIEQGFSPEAATRAITQVSADTNVSVKEAGDAVFQFSRTFHTLGDAATAASDGISLLKLDNVSLADTVKLSTSLYQQFGLTLGGLHSLYNMLAAGQREYNARISDTIPLLRTAAGAVANAGGDPNQLAQIAIIASRTYPGQGGQLGTAIARAAAVDIPKNLIALQSGFGLGYGSEAHDPTALILHAMHLAGGLSTNDRQRLSALIFEPRYGARFAGLFGQQGAQLAGQITTNITPDKTQNALQTELNKELATAHQRWQAVTNEIQRAGAAFGSSGIINDLSLLASGGVRAGDALSSVIEAFDRLPGFVKQTVEALLLIRGAQLFTQRTRFGSTAADAIGLSRLPGFGASEAQDARFQMRAGTTQALEAETQRWMQSRARLIALGVRQVELERRRDDIAAQINASEEVDEKLVAQSNTIRQRITALQREQIALEQEEVAQQATREQLIAQRTALTRTRGPGAMSDAEVLALYGRTNVGTSVIAEAEAGPAAGEATLAQAVSARWANLRAKLGRGEAAIGAETGLLRGAANTVTGFGDRLAGMVASIDPLTAGLIALPIAAGQIKQAIDNSNQAAQAAQDALTVDLPGNAAQQLRERAQRLNQATEQQRQSDLPHSQVFGRGVFNWLGVPGLADLISPRHDNPLAQPARNLGQHYQDYATQFQQDAKALLLTQPGRQRLYQESQRLEAAAAAGARAAFAGHPEMVKQAIESFNGWLQQLYQTAVNAGTAHAQGPEQQFQMLSRLSDTQLQRWGQAYSERSRIYGLGGGDLSGAIGAAMTMAARYRNSSDPTQLQALQTAQQAVADAVNRNVTTLVNASKTAGSYGGAQTDLTRALGGVNQARGTVQQWVNMLRRTWGRTPGMMAKINDFATQLNQMLDQSVSNILQTQLADIKTQADVRTSNIGGISPEADLQRAQSDLQGLRDQLHAARRAGDWKQAADLQAQVNNSARQIQQQQAQNALAISDAYGQLRTSRITGISPEADLRRAASDLQTAREHLAETRQAGMGEAAIAQAQADVNDKLNALHKDQIDYADSLAQAYEQLAVSRITGITPADDMRRAQQDVDNARKDLARDRAEGKGLPQILQDQANLNDKLRALNEQAVSNASSISQDAAAFIQSQEALAASQTTDPVARAADQLVADIRILATIKRSDYKTAQEYLTARNNQLAKINQDQIDKTSSIVDTRMQTLQFELHTQQISGQQYIYGLEQLLKLHHLSRQQVEQIRGAIYDEAHAQAVNLNTANIRLPTTYEVRRAIAGAMRQGGRIPQNTGTVINHHVSNRVTITVNAGNAAELRRVATILDRTTKGNLAGRARAAGLI